MTMDTKGELVRLRAEIDEVDAALVPLFARRMAVAAEIARVKREGNLSVQDETREARVVQNAQALAGEELKGEAALLMRSVMTLSRAYQRRLLFGGPAPLLPPPAAPVTENVTCAYQGVPGAWGEQAAACLFPAAQLQAEDHFEDVFTAVKSGGAHYGVVPIENSKTGAIGETYDLLRQHGCYIVGRCWVPIRQCLVGLPGAHLEGIKEVLSHPEGLRQCRRFLQGKSYVQTACRNTAVAAKRVAEGGDAAVAAIASRRAAKLYGLQVLAPDIMDAADNRTSFVVIAARPEYNEESDLVSITFSTQHRSGALCEVLMAFMADGINLSRIESRPAAAADQYRFFAEVEGNINDPRLQAALAQAAAASGYFEVLGCYRCTPCQEDA